ncbi:hypothetical protein GJ699_10705 [Duganella sp. FT80W]|uniref:F5/8 type C domain-containing protein n=1 Tax=Duganella guangzhouensis TaxID=2666084 RepID=A0A6I2KWF0_9BURK|nr:discoidin domain-containing protein [Duganella guangzhouensis]MRW90455.1 hypothetical protein [Duganella guangzhouensis]
MFKRFQFQAVLLSSALAACGGGNSSSPQAGATDQLAASTISAQDNQAMELATTPVTTLASAVATPNLALYQPVSVSSAESSATGGGYAVDGQGSTRWSSQFSDSQWIAVDLGAATAINHVTLQWETAYGKSYALQTSTDNVNWRTVYSNGNGGGGTEEARFSATSARWVRMLGYQRATPWGYSLYELKVYNDAGGGSNPLPTDAIFAPGSFWYQPIPANVTLHANSAGYVADFLRQIRTYYGNVTINTTAYASPVFQPPAGIASVKVTQWDCQHKGYLDSSLAQQWASVPVPSAATPSDGSDGEMTIYQPSSNTLWEFWQARKVSGQWQACWGGRMTNVAASSGIWPPGYGTTATGLPFIGGQITAEELKRGEIRHVIGIALVDLEKAGIYSWPANRSDGYNPGNAANRIPEGSRFRLDPNLNVEAIAMHPVARIIARAAQKYGFVVWDKAGAISLRVQNPKSYTALGQADPYTALFNGTPNYALLNGFPWDKLQFLPKDYGKP